MVGKFLPIEAASVIGGASNLARRLPAEIGHHSDAAAVAAKTIMETIALAHVRQRIQSKSDVAGPGMGDLEPAQLREAIGHVAIEDRRANRRVDMCETGAAAEHHAPAVRR